MTVTSLQRRRRADALYEFVEGAAELLASHDEARRCRLENRLLAMLPDLRDTPLFDVLDIRDPALRAMLCDGDDGAFAASPFATDNRPAYLAY